MTEIPLSPYATAFRFDDIPDYYTCVFLIETERRVFLLDTFAGPDSMTALRQRIDAIRADRQAVVVNSHFHWDHVWGNSAFKDFPIVAHERCRETLAAKWDEQIERSGQYMQGRAERVLPTITFGDRLSFPEDGLELFHSPGHTGDSISLFDRRTESLYVFDNLERPIVYVEGENVDRYIATLENYRRLNPKHSHGSHTVNLDAGDITSTIRYLKQLQEGIPMTFATDYETKVHQENLEWMGKRI
jgi:glyoxylase-like metal-dependent hydrolase (beta-lactamase superfamily II)